MQFLKGIFLIVWVGLLNFVFIAFAQAGAPLTPQARAGVLDLRDWDFSANPTIPLKGELGFSWQKFLKPDEATDTFYEGSWQEGFPQTHYGYASYKLKILLPIDKKQTYMIYLRNISTAYKMWVNGDLMAQSGVVGTSKEVTMPQMSLRYARLEAINNEVDILFHVANFHKFETGLTFKKNKKVDTVISIGDIDYMGNLQRKRLTKDILFITIFITISLYHFTLFFYNSKQLYLLYFSLLCFTTGILNLCVGEILLVNIFPQMNWIVLIKSIYILNILIVVWLVLYLYFLFENLYSKFFYNIVVYFATGFVIFYLFASGNLVRGSEFFIRLGSLIIVIVMLAGLIKAVKQKRQGTWILLITFTTTFGLLFIESILSYYYGTLHIRHFGMIVAIFMQTILIAQRNSKAYKDLDILSTNLEQTVSQRTSQLEKANFTIQKLNQHLKEENQRMGSELDITRRLQKLLQPSENELKVVKHLDISGINVSATEVGGDYYDVLPLDEHVMIGMGDVTGHGLESGMIMLMTQMGVRSLLEAGINKPDAVLQVLNRSLYKNIERMKVDKSLTLSLLEYHYEEPFGHITFSGQHEEILLIKADGTMSAIDTIDSGFPLGLTTDIDELFRAKNVKLAQGDGIVLYTDGITEAPNRQGELYGLSRLQQTISANWSMPAKNIVRAVLKNVYKFAGIYNGEILDLIDDDITILVIKQH